MDFRDLSQIDLKMHLLSGSAIQIDNLLIEPYTIREIQAMGYANYMQSLQFLSLTVDDFIKSTDNMELRIQLQAEKSKLKTFDFYAASQEGQMTDLFLQAVAMICKTGDVRLLDEGFVAVDFEKMGILYETPDGTMAVDDEWLGMIPENKVKIITRENFDEIARIIKYQNFLDTVKGEEFNPANEEARKLAEQMERNRKRVEAKKKAQQYNEKGDDGEIDISDIISAVTAKSNSINKFNVWDLTLYQLYDEYSRLELIDNYEVNLKAMFAGNTKVDLKHWSSKV